MLSSDKGDEQTLTRKKTEGGPKQGRMLGKAEQQCATLFTVTTLGLAPVPWASETHGQAKVKNHLMQAPEECVFETGKISKSQVMKS